MKQESAIEEGGDSIVYDRECRKRGLHELSATEREEAFDLLATMKMEVDIGCPPKQSRETS